MKRSTFKKSVLTLAAVSVVPFVGIATTYADSDHGHGHEHRPAPKPQPQATSFTQQYQANLSKENSLLATVTAASSASSSSNAQTLLSAVQNMNAQIQSLYTEEQTLASINLPTPVKPNPQQPNVVQKLSDLFQVMLSAEQKHELRNYHAAMNQWKQYQKKLGKFSQHSDDQDRNAQGQPPQSNKDLIALQNSILTLQQTAIDYTQNIIASLGAPTQVSASTSIAIANGAVVTNLGLNQVTVVSGTSSQQLTASVKSADGSHQSYVVTDPNGNGYNGQLSTGDKLRVVAANGSTTADYTIIVAAAPLSSDVQIQAVANTPYVVGINGQTITVSSNTTAPQLTSTIHSTDGSAQNYVITDGLGNSVAGTLATGDVLKVTAANGSTAALYVIQVQ